MSSQVITPELVTLDVAPGSSPAAVIRHLAVLVAAAGRTTGAAGAGAGADADAIAEAAIAREESAPTGVPGGTAIPHFRSEVVAEPTLAFTRLSRPVDFGGPDGPSDLVFLIAMPGGAGSDGGKEHLKLLSALARGLLKKDFRAALRGAETPEELVAEVNLRIASARKPRTPGRQSPATAAGDAPAQANRDDDRNAGNLTVGTRTTTRIVAVTSCPTGIAHTYLAADALRQAARGRRDVELYVEAQGSSTVETIDPDVIGSADAVIFATDVGVRGKSRFGGKPVVEDGVNRAINDPGALIDEAVAAAADPGAPTVPRTEPGQTDPTAPPTGIGTARPAGRFSWMRRIQRAVMTGVSFMIPFVTAGGLLMALGFLFGGYDVAGVAEDVAREYSPWELPGHVVPLADGTTAPLDREGWALYLGAILFTTGDYGMGAIVAVLSAFTAYGLAGRPGIAPGFIGGVISVAIGAGFLGGLVTGILAGLFALGLTSLQVPRWLASLMPVVVIPLLASLGVGLAMFLVLGRPLTSIMEGLAAWLGGLSGSSAVLLGVLVGLMMCIDLGGPVNKAAYLFATAGLSTGDPASMQVMAAVMGAGMVPPLAMALASAIAPRLYGKKEREAGKAGWLLGASFISEGAIPFAAVDPMRVIPSLIVGGAVTGGTSMAFGAASRAPHGGVFVFFAIDNVLGWLTAVVAGTVVAALLVTVLKRLFPRKATTPRQPGQDIDAEEGASESTGATAGRTPGRATGRAATA